MKDRFSATAMVIVVASSLIVGFIGGGSHAAKGNRSVGNRFLEDVNEALDVIQQNYVEPVDRDRMLFSAIKEMLHALDPHSSFFDPKEFARLREEEHSKYYGLGITVRRLRPENGRSVVIEPPVEGSPAARVGMRAGDVLTHIAGSPLDNLTPDEILERLRGERGSWVSITVERPEVRKPLQFKVERDEIPISTVPYAFEISPGIGFVKIEKFSESTADELRSRLDKLNAGSLSGLILDLRSNPGGLLTQAIEVADLFLPRGQAIVSTKGRVRGSERMYRTVGLNKIRVPMVVLINGNSASASEIVAGALQDHDRALIVGERSFGKGLVQSVYTLGGNTAIALTTARYLTPSGRQIQREYSGAGIEYFFQRGEQPGAGETGETRITDSGRQVRGGGGIAPDVEAPAGESNRFESLLASKLVFFEYARRLTLAQVPAASRFTMPPQKERVAPRLPGNAPNPVQLEITRTILEDFAAYLRERKIVFTEKDFADNLDFIKRGIHQEVCTITLGRQEGYKIAIQGDLQVKRAVEVLPDARMLANTGHFIPRPPAAGAR